MKSLLNYLFGYTKPTMAIQGQDAVFYYPDGSVMYFNIRYRPKDMR